MCVESSGFVELLLLFVDFMLGCQGSVSHNSTIVSCVKKALIYQIGGQIITDNISKSASITCLRKPGSQCFISKYMALIYLSSIPGPSSLFLQSNPKYLLVISKLHLFQGNFSFLLFLTHKTHKSLLLVPSFGSLQFSTIIIKTGRYN